MTQHAAQSAPSRSVLSANDPLQVQVPRPRGQAPRPTGQVPPPTAQAPRPASASDSRLVGGVAAQDAMVALFDDYAEEEPPKMRSGILRLFRHNDAPAEAMLRRRK